MIDRTDRRRRWGVAVVAVVLVAGCGGVDGPAPGVDTIDAAAAVELLADRDEVTIVDVRTPEEHASGHLDGAVLLDLAGGQFAAEVGDLDRDAAYLLYCRTGSRSAEAAAMMDDLGFAEVHDAGGYDDLVAAGAAAAS